MGVKIGETYTTKVGLKSLITYTCVSCRSKQIGEYNVEAESVASASIFQNGRRIAEENKAQAVGNLFSIDSANREAVNNNHSYLCLTHPIKCCNCGTVQPWSDATEHPKKKTVSSPALTICIMMSVFSLATLSDGLWGMGLVCLLIAGSIIGYYVYNNKRYKNITAENEKIREKAIEQFLFDGYELPMYYRRNDIAELLASEYSAEVLSQYPNLVDTAHQTINWPK